MDHVSSVSSRTPSPMGDSNSVNVATNHRSNPFSIDYILSSAAAVAVKQGGGESSKSHNLVEQSQAMQSLISHQDRNQMAAAVSGAGSGADFANLPVAIQVAMSHLKLPNEQITAAQQQGQQTQMHPNFLYFMAYMLLQRQQQQAAAQQILQNEANHRRQQHRQQQPPQQQLAVPRQPLNLASQPPPSPMESLAILARLTGGQPPLPGPAQETNGSIGKQMRPQQFVRHQPYLNPASHQHHQQHLNRLAGPFAPIGAQRNQPLHPLGGPHQQNVPMMEHQQHRIGAQPQVARSHRQISAAVGHLLPASNNNMGTCYKMNTALDQHHQHAIRNSNGCANGNDDYRSKGNNAADSFGSHQSNGQTTNLEKLDNLKPAHSYIGLIGMCILSSPEKRMVLNDIYQFILDNYPYYRNRGSGWRNSVRHNLSLNECFQKAGRAANGKGHYWTIHPANMEDFMLGDFRRRRAQRKVRRWNNMDVPSDESDDESMDDANKPPLPEHFKRSIEMHKRLELSYQKSVVTGPDGSTAAAFMAAAAAAVGATSPRNATPNSGLACHGLVASSSAAMNHSRSSPVFIKQPELS